MQLWHLNRAGRPRPSPTVSKLRLTLAILSIGFAIEGAIEAYTYVSRSYGLPYAGSIFILGPIVTLVGLLVLSMGRREWDDLLSRQFRHAHRTFGLSLVALIVALGLIAWYAYYRADPVSPLASWGFGAAAMAALVLTFATYVLIALHLTPPIGKVLLLVGLGWAAVVSLWIGQALAQGFGVIMLALRTRTLTDGSFNASMAGLGSYLALTYALLIIVYVDAFRRASGEFLRSRPTPVAPPVA